MRYRAALWFCWRYLRIRRKRPAISEQAFLVGPRISSIAMTFRAYSSMSLGGFSHLVHQRRPEFISSTPSSMANLIHVGSRAEGESPPAGVLHASGRARRTPECSHMIFKSVAKLSPIDQGTRVHCRQDLRYLAGTFDLSLLAVAAGQDRASSASFGRSLVLLAVDCAHCVVDVFWCVHCSRLSLRTVQAGYVRRTRGPGSQGPFCCG